MTYEIAEKFKSVQGEGVYAGTPMAFIRFVGCSVGKRICQHCDTDFDRTMPWRGGGVFDMPALLVWAQPYKHVCLTGGEPFDQQDLVEFRRAFGPACTIHVETSGTRPDEMNAWHVATIKDRGIGDLAQSWLCVSPKPGFRESAIALADEVKVIVPGLGELTPALELELKERHKDIAKPHWPTLEDARRWARDGKTVFLQPRNGKIAVDQQNLMYVQDLLREYPELRLSVQMHKILKVQ